MHGLVKKGITACLILSTNVMSVVATASPSCRDHYYDKSIRKAGTYVWRGAALAVGATIGIVGAVAGIILSAGMSTAPTIVGGVAIGANVAGLGMGAVGLGAGGIKMISPVSQVYNNRQVDRLIVAAERHFSNVAAPEWNTFFDKHFPAKSSDDSTEKLHKVAQLLLEMNSNNSACYVINLEEDTLRYFSYKPLSMIVEGIMEKLNPPSVTGSLL